MELTRELAGTAEPRAKVAYGAQHRELELQDLTFDYDWSDAELALNEDPKTRSASASISR
jgi:hypothetical protein